MGLYPTPTGLKPFIEIEGVTIKVRNGSGGTLSAGNLVYISSYNATDGVVIVDKADADYLSKSAVLVIAESIANGKVGYAAYEGLIPGLVTTGRTVGDKVYLSQTAGAWTASTPTGAVEQVVGVVTKVHATQGKIRFFPGRRVFTGLSNSLYLFSDVADGNIGAYRLVELDANGDLIAGTAGSLRIVGANSANAAKVSPNAIDIALGKTTLYAAEPITAGAQLKCGVAGAAVCLNNANKAAGTIKTTSAGLGFANQPANDSITLVSDSASDVQVATIIGTTNGGVVVVTENVTLTGVTPAVSVKTDWGVILAIKLASAAVGTITITETSGGLTITTIAPAGTAKGVETVTASAQGCHNTLPSATCSSTGTKTVGIKYIAASDGATAAYEAVALNGATAAPFATAALLVTEVYTGDLEATRTCTIKTSATEDDENARCGKAFAAADAAATFAAIVTP